MTSSIIDSFAKFIQTVGFPGAMAVLFIWLLHRQLPKITESIRALNKDNLEAHKDLAKENRKANSEIAKENRTAVREISQDYLSSVRLLTADKSEAVKRAEERAERSQQTLISILSEQALEFRSNKTTKLPEPEEDPH